MLNSLASKIKNKDVAALSRSISIIENRLPGYKKLLSSLFSSRKQSQKIGITGPPGSGKSTIVNKISDKYIKENKTVGIICVDPSSPFNGGAILGDRVRMDSIHMSDNVFIRSIATRGSLGGLSESISDIEVLYESFGFDIIIYETVGVGQIEIDVMNYCDTVVLVMTPESGDDIQMMKAGLIECSDIIVINKSDREGGDKILTFLGHYLKKTINKKAIPVIKLIAIQDVGIKNLIKEILDHYKFLLKNKMIIKKNNERYKNILLNIAYEQFISNFLSKDRLKMIKHELNKNDKDRLSPYELFNKIK